MDFIGTTHAPQVPTLNVIFTDTARSSKRIFGNHGGVIQTGRDGTMPRDGNTSIRSPRYNSPVLIGRYNTISPTRTGSHEIGIPKGPTGPVEVRNYQIFNTSINVNLTNNGDPTPTVSKSIRLELSHNSISNIFSRCWVNFTRNAVITEIPDL